MTTVCYRDTTLLIDLCFGFETGISNGEGEGTLHGGEGGGGHGRCIQLGEGYIDCGLANGEGYMYASGVSNRDLDGDGGCQIL